MDESEDRKDLGWSGESSDLEEWNFVVHSNKRNAGTDEAISDGESVEILTRERAEDSSPETDELCENESQDNVAADSDNASDADDDDNSNVNDNTAECNCEGDNEADAEEEPSLAVTPAGVFPEENIIPAHSTETDSNVAVKSELELPLESRKIIVIAGLVLFIGWFLLVFHVRSEENIDKIKLDNDVKWQAMNEKYSKLMQELAIYKEKSQLMDLSLNDLKALQVDGKAENCKLSNDDKWQQMQEKYLKLEKELYAFKLESSSSEEVQTSPKSRTKPQDFSINEKLWKSSCDPEKTEKSSYCDRNGQDLPQHSEILRLIQRLDSKSDSESSVDLGDEPESVDLMAKFFNIKRAFETSDVKSFDEDFETLFSILTKDKDESAGIDLNFLVQLNSELYAHFISMIDESEKFTDCFNKTDSRSAEEFDSLARISYDYILSNLQKVNFNVAKLVNSYQDFSRGIMIDIGYSARSYGQNYVRNKRNWRSAQNENENSKFHEDRSFHSSSSVDRDDSTNQCAECINSILYHRRKVTETNKKLSELIHPENLPDSGYSHIVCDHIQSNLKDADVVLSQFMDSFDSFTKKAETVKFDKKHSKKDFKDKSGFKTKKGYAKHGFNSEEHQKTHQRVHDEKSEDWKERKGKPMYNQDQEEGSVFKFVKSKINNYRKIISDKASIFNKKIKNHTIRVKDKIQKKLKSVLDFEKAKKFNEKIVHHGTKIKNKLSQKFDSLWNSVSKKLKNASDIAVASSEWLFDFGDDREKEEAEVYENEEDEQDGREQDVPSMDRNNNKEEKSLDVNDWMFKRAEFRNSKREDIDDTAHWYFRRGSARRRNVENYRKL